MWDVVVYYRNGKAERFEFSDEASARAKASALDDRTVSAIELYGPNGEYEGEEL